MGKRNKKKNAHKYASKVLVWEDIEELSKSVITQLTTQVKVAEFVKEEKQRINFVNNQKVIEKKLEERLKTINKEMTDEELKLIKTDVIKDYITLSEEEYLIINGYLSALDDLFKRVNIVVKNHAKVSEEEKEIKYKKGKVSPEDMQVYVMCFGKYIEIEEDAVNLVTKSLVELSSILGDGEECKNILLDAVHAINKELNTEIGEENGE